MRGRDPTTPSANVQRNRSRSFPPPTQCGRTHKRHAHHGSQQSCLRRHSASNCAHGARSHRRSPISMPGLRYGYRGRIRYDRTVARNYSPNCKHNHRTRNIRCARRTAIRDISRRTARGKRRLRNDGSYSRQPWELVKRANAVGSLMFKRHPSSRVGTSAISWLWAHTTARAPISSGAASNSG